MSELAVAFGLTLVFATPLALSLWALLDAAKRPAWAWALAERRQVVWIAAILIGVLVLPLGLALSIWYLARIRPHLAAVEGGDFT